MPLQLIVFGTLRIWQQVPYSVLSTQYSVSGFVTTATYGTGVLLHAGVRRGTSDFCRYR